MFQTVQTTEILVPDTFQLISSDHKFLELMKRDILEIVKRQAGEQIVGEVDLDEIRLEHVLILGNISMRCVVELTHVTRVGEKLARVIEINAERAQLIVADVERTQEYQIANVDLSETIERQVERVELESAHVQVGANAERGDVVVS